MSQFDELPEGWTEVRLEEVAEKVGSGATPRGGSKSYQQSGVPLIRSMNVHFDGLHEEGLVYLDDKQAEGLKNVEVKPNDVLLNITGASIGRVTQAPFNLNGARVNQHVCIIRPIDNFDPAFLTKYLASPKVQKIITAEEYGMTRQALTKQMILDFEVPLPPVNEQRRIVEKIEALTARSRKARAALDEIPALLDQFRQSVLAAAFRGDLTADWRAQNPEINKNWHQELVSSFRASLKQSKRQGRLWGSGTFVQEIDESWDAIPDSWNWVKVIDLGYNPEEVVQIGPMSMKSNEFIDEGTIVLNVGCIQWSGISIRKCNFLPPERASDFERYRLKTNDILFTRSGEVGRCAILPSNLESALMTFHLLRVRTAPNICIPEYLYLCFRGCIAVEDQIDNSTIGATRAGFNTKLLQNIWIPLPPIKEQVEILSKIKQRFTRMGLLESQITEFYEELIQLDQSILAKAFRGELVPQDPNDESAAVLLDRIRAERERLGSGKKRGKAKA